MVKLVDTLDSKSGSLGSGGSSPPTGTKQKKPCLWRGFLFGAGGRRAPPPVRLIAQAIWTRNEVKRLRSK